MHRLALAAILSSSVLAQTWCGKRYEHGQSPIVPGGSFPLPVPSTDTLLALRCAPAIRPYLAEDFASPAAVLIDVPVVHYHIANAKPIRLASNQTHLDVTVSLDGRTLVTGSVPLNASAYELSFSLEGIMPQKASYNLSCHATYASQSYSATAALSVLPNPANSSVTKMDLHTGVLLAKPATGLGGAYKPMFSIGYYTYDGYLSANLSLIDDLKEQGFTIIQPVLIVGNLTALNLIIDKMQEVGLYLMYGVRSSYMNSTLLAEQVNMIKNRPNLLLWHTGDEPDGTLDPLNATTIAYDLIYDLDGYHPVSLVLNCQDYYWPNYTTGTDVVMQDMYMIGNNVNWSTVRNTTCTPGFGDCGCDNCLSIPAGDAAAVPPNSSYYGDADIPPNSGVGSYFDISDRVASFKNRLEVVGWECTKAVWTVPQAFGGSTYWTWTPTGQEWVVQSIMGINQGALGVVPWNEPTTADIKHASSEFAQSLPQIMPYLFNPASVRTTYVVGGVSVATWRADEQTLVLAANTYYVNQSVVWDELGLKGAGVSAVFKSGNVKEGEGGFVVGPVSSGAFVVA